jgi:hypothetical protein
MIPFRIILIVLGLGLIAAAGFILHVALGLILAGVGCLILESLVNDTSKGG